MPMSSQNRITLDNLEDTRVVEIQIRLVRIEPVPIIGARRGIPSPVRFFGVEKDDPGFRELLVGVGPDIEVAFARAGLCLTGALEPGMLIGGVIDHELGDDAQTALVCGFDKGLELLHACRSQG